MNSGMGGTCTISNGSSATKEMEDKTISLALTIVERRMRAGSVFVDGASDLVTYLRLKLGELDHEAFYVVYMDIAGRILHHELLFRGSLTSSHVYPREIMREVFKHNAASLIIAHNHPQGTEACSPMDITMTKNLMEALSYIDCLVMDHIIVTATSFYSMDEHGKMPVLT